MTNKNEGGKYRFPKKPRICPVCKSKIVGTYAYGLQTYDEEQQKKIKEGRVILGGCVIDYDQPVWGCEFCGTDFYNLPTDEYMQWVFDQDKKKSAAVSEKLGK